MDYRSALILMLLLFFKIHNVTIFIIYILLKVYYIRPCLIKLKKLSVEKLSAEFHKY